MKKYEQLYYKEFDKKYRNRSEFSSLKQENDEKYSLFPSNKINEIETSSTKMVGEFTCDGKQYIVAFDHPDGIYIIVPINI